MVAVSVLRDQNLFYAKNTHSKWDHYGPPGFHLIIKVESYAKSLSKSDTDKETERGGGST